MNFGTVAILGPGLIGGSLARALAERGLADRLLIYARSSRAREEIGVAGIPAELTGDPREAVRDADVVVLCVPIDALPALVRECRDVLKPEALVTDVGSVKGSVETALAPLLAGRARWIGSHPMAGSEQSGFGAARAGLFENAAVIVTPTPATAPGVQARAEQFWRALGARVYFLEPKFHDLAVAEISHVPHLLAALIAARVTPESLPLAGGGFRDTTRVASGSPELWTEILWANRRALQDQCGALATLLRDLHEMFASGDEAQKSALFKLLQDAKSVRDQLAHGATRPL